MVFHCGLGFSELNLSSVLKNKAQRFLVQPHNPCFPRCCHSCVCRAVPGCADVAAGMMPLETKAAAAAGHLKAAQDENGAERSLLLSLFHVLVSDSAGICHFQAFSYLGFFPLSCLWSFIPAAPQHPFPLSAQFFGLFSHSHSSLSTLLVTQWISAVSISVQHVPLTHRPEE